MILSWHYYRNQFSNYFIALLLLRKFDGCEEDNVVTEMHELQHEKTPEADQQVVLYATRMNSLL